MSGNSKGQVFFFFGAATRRRSYQGVTESVCSRLQSWYYYSRHGDHTMSELVRTSGHESRDLHNFVSNHCNMNPNLNGCHNRAR